MRSYSRQYLKETKIRDDKNKHGSSMMLRKISLIIGIFSIVFTAYGIPLYHYQTNSSTNLQTMDATSINNNNSEICHSLALCHFVKTKFSVPLSKKYDSTAMQARSYYSYGATTSPAPFYPAFDSLSILASLAFLAFLIQSFASLFDRSRSIIPTIISSRNSPMQFDPPDPIKLAMRTLNEYDIFNNRIILNDAGKRRGKLS